jgi:hypothetical protein
VETRLKDGVAQLGKLDGAFFLTVTGEAEAGVIGYRVAGFSALKPFIEFFG